MSGLFSVIPSFPDNEGGPRPTLLRTHNLRGIVGWASAHRRGLGIPSNQRMSQAQDSPEKSGGPSTPASLPVSPSGFVVTLRDASAQDDSDELSCGGARC